MLKKKIHFGKSNIKIEKKIKNKAKYYLYRIELRKKLLKQTIDNWFMLQCSFFPCGNIMKFLLLLKIDFLSILKINVRISKINTLWLQI